jgi:hypothetical protein
MFLSSIENEKLVEEILFFVCTTVEATTTSDDK